jgi:hypothetical protein
MSLCHGAVSSHHAENTGQAPSTHGYGLPAERDIEESSLIKDQLALLAFR